MRAVLMLALAALLAGCLCGGGDVPQPPEPTTTEEPALDTTTTTEAPIVVEETTSTQMETTTTLEFSLVNCSTLRLNIDRDTCWYARAAQQRDPALCKRIIQPDASRICSGILLSGKCSGITNNGLRITCEAALKRDPDLCKKLIHRDISSCYMSVAIFNNDTSICGQALDREDRVLCYALAGSCSQLTAEADISLCHRKVQDTIYSIT